MDFGAKIALKTEVGNQNAHGGHIITQTDGFPTAGERTGIKFYPE
jgi:hypothetical protein